MSAVADLAPMPYSQISGGTYGNQNSRSSCHFINITRHTIKYAGQCSVAPLASLAPPTHCIKAFSTFVADEETVCSSPNSFGAYQAG
jgi:hypothetical protein